METTEYRSVTEQTQNNVFLYKLTHVWWSRNKLNRVCYWRV